MGGKERGEEERGNQSKRLLRKGMEGITQVPVNTCSGGWGVSLGSQNRTA